MSFLKEYEKELLSDGDTWSCSAARILRHITYGHIICKKYILHILINYDTEEVFEEIHHIYHDGIKFNNVYVLDDLNYRDLVDGFMGEIMTSIDAGFEVYIKYMQPMQLKKAITSHGFYDVDVICNE